MTVENFPIVVVGAGPAGSVASLFLAEKGIDHLLLDKGTFPRDKICGDAVSGKILDILAKFKPREVAAFGNNNEKSILSYGMKFVAPSGKSVDIAFPKPKGDLPVGFISKRTEFDDFLFGLTKNNHSVRWQGAEVVNAVYEGGKVRLFIQQNGEEKEVITPLIIAADGSRSVVKKKLMGEDMEEKHFCGGIRAYYKNVADMHPENYLELHFYKELLPGYFWIFPLPNGNANVGLGMRSDVISKRKANLRLELLKLVEQHPLLRKRFENATLDGKIQGWGLPLGSKKRIISANNLILTGDAASLIDPFTGEGIGNAGISGMVAARAAVKAIESNNYSANFLKQYDEEIYRKLWNELKLSHSIQRISSVPWLFNFVVNRITNNKALQNVFTNMFYDLEMREKLKNPLFYLKLLAGKV